ncbi:piggyBac transposable element-derived protein 4-like [Melanaphis sacchari]|uniref:piggyBac transposable element-derived protein 4-like n=1 Tax=Melanaphis sacchari TaxID=742174 RepID=UPI000DC15914|nr:piggyBac transposable element-derived protein 4-like [Melanaphis sacchari]
MDLPPGPSRERSRSPIYNKTNKTKILTDEELLLLLENDKWLSSEDDFDGSSDDNFEGILVDDFDNMAEVEEGNSNNDSHYMCLDSSTMNEMSDNSNNSLRKEPNNYETSWLSDPANANYIPFTATPGLKCVPEGNAPIDYFRLLVTDSFFDLLVEETNAYALDIFLNQTHESARINNWVDTNRKEMEIFIGLLFHMGTIRLSRLEDYWKTSRLFNIPCFREYMSRNRFMLILRALHFTRNPKEGEPIPHNRLYKIQSVLNYFNSKMEEVYEPPKNLSIDESMILWRGRLVFRQYIKNKRHKYGVKSYMLTEPWGFIHRVMVYSGQGHDISNTMSHTEYVVFKLMNGLFYEGRSLFMDNYYNSVHLSKLLLEKKTFVTGTLRSNRKNNPKDVIDKKLKKGESIYRYTKEGICVLKWKDKRDVLMISSEFSHSMCEVSSRTEVRQKPIIVKKYNENMSGIDRQDQMASYYPCERKSLRNVKKISLYDYKISVIESLLPKKDNKTQKNSEVKKTEAHLPKKVEKNEKNRYYKKRCKVCADKKIRKETIYYCDQCEDEPGLCLEQCFKEFHK